MAWLGTWAKRIPVTAKYTEGGTQRIDATLTDFPALIHISAACGIGGAFDASCVFDELENDVNRLKIAITTSDGVTECYGEIEKWDDANEQAWIHVKIPSASHTADTPLYLYYDKNHAASNKDGSAGNKIGDCADGSAATHAVWDANYLMVYHMNSPSNAQLIDSTDNNYDSTLNTLDTAAGKIGLGMNSNNEYAKQATLLDTVPAAIVIEYWFKNSNKDAARWLFNKRNVGITDRFIGGFSGTTGFLFFHTVENNHGLIVLYGDIDVADGAWHYGAFVWNTSDGKIIQLDAATAHVVDAAETTLMGSGTQTDLFICSSYVPSLYFNGDVDEFRISGANRTAAWRKASYYSGGDDLLTWGSEEVLRRGPGFVLFQDPAIV